LFERIEQLLQRIQGYPWYEVIVELVLIWLVVYMVFRFLRGTRGARVIKGVAVVLVMGTLVIKVLSTENAFERLDFLYSGFLAFASIALVIVFQPELRRALTRLGEASLFPVNRARKAHLIEEICESFAYLSKNKIGAVLAIERQVGLGGILESGTRIDAHITSELLDTIFWPGSALHDMGVVIRGNRIVAAGVQFPLADGEGITPELGSRHRAALGLSLDTDAVVLVVSEETGIISVAERGKLRRNFTVDELRDYLAHALGQADMANADEADLDEPTVTATKKTEAA